MKLNSSFEYLPTSGGDIGAFVRNPARITGSARFASKPSPVVGEDSDAILESIGVGADERKAMRERNVVS